MNFKRALEVAATSLFVAFMMGTSALARTPANIEYASTQPTKVAALGQPLTLEAKNKRGALATYDYGKVATQPSGPTIDLRGAFSDEPVAPKSRLSFEPAPVAEPEGPLDITPPWSGQEDALLGAPAAEPVNNYAAPPRGLYLVQVGAFSVRDNAERTRDRASAAGAVLMDVVDRPAGSLYRVRVGPWPSREAAEAARAAVADLGFADARVTTAD